MQPNPTLKEAVAAFAAWRRNRAGSCARTPDTLRQMALALTAHYPTHQVVKTLGLSGSSISQWRREAASTQVQSTAFVPLTAQADVAAALRQVSFDFDNGETLTLGGRLSQSRLLGLVQAVLQLPAQSGA